MCCESWPCTMLASPQLKAHYGAGPRAPVRRRAAEQAPLRGLRPLFVEPCFCWRTRDSKSQGCPYRSDCLPVMLGTHWRTSYILKHFSKWFSKYPAADRSNFSLITFFPLIGCIFGHEKGQTASYVAVE